MLINEKGFVPIAGLGFIIAAIIILIVLGIGFLFFKSLFAATILFAIAVAFFYAGINTNSKQQQFKTFFFVGGIILVAIALPVAIIQPFSVIENQPSYGITVFDSKDGIVYEEVGTNLAQLFALVQANCNLVSPFDECVRFGETYLTYVIPFAQVNAYSELQGYKNGKYVKEAYYGGSNEGSIGNGGIKLYYTDTCYSSWQQLGNNCDSTGCAFEQVASPSKKVLATTGNSFSNKCPVYIAWSKATYMGGYSWVTAGYGWVGTSGVSGTVVECVDNSDCSGQETCSNENTCEVKVCDEGQKQCNGFQQQTCSNNAWQTNPIQTGVCGVQCTTNSQCDSGETTRVCQNSKVYDVVNTPSCNTSNYTCGSTNNSNVIETCEFGCSTDSPTCAEPPPIDYVTPIAGIIVLLILVLGIYLVFFRNKKRRRR